MARGKTVDLVTAEMEQLLDVWDENDDFQMGGLKKADVRAKVAEVRGKRDEIEGLDTHITGLRADLRGQVKEMRQLITRMRSGYRAQYGPDSKQYEQAGGVPTRARGKRTASKQGKNDPDKGK